MEIKLISKELSWLSFNERVLQEAESPSVPIIERIRFLGIFSNNLDEFFRVRVAEVKRMIELSKKETAQGEDPQQLLDQINNKVISLQRRFEKTYRELILELTRHHIYLINEKQLDASQAEYVRQVFHSQVLPVLSPFIIDRNSTLPPLKDQSIYLAVQLNQNESSTHFLLEIPTDQLQRFIFIPSSGSKRQKSIIILDNIIRYCLADLFQGIIEFDSIEAYTIKLTRDAELELDEGISQSLLDKLTQSLKRRKKGELVRFVYDEEMPDDFHSMLCRKLGLNKYDSQIAGGRYHNFKDFIDFPNVGRSYLENKQHIPLPSMPFEQASTLFEAIRQQDVLLYYPYHTFRYFIDWLRQASIDPTVTKIQITLYRVAKNSKVINALINAAKNQKQVTVVVELQARFDEEANIEWAKQLTEEGVKVIFGIPGLKVHSKLCLITRKENTKLVNYAHIGTGNFHERTANVYTDFSLFTADPTINAEIERVFDFIEYPYKDPQFDKLIVSPKTTRTRLNQLIDAEIAAANAQKPAEILLKLNNLVDTQLIKKLYKASQAGVKIRLIVRGMCSLVPGVKGISDNIEAISIIDKFLEHPRVFCFHNHGDPVYYIASADLMTRNVDYRVEVICPIQDPQLKQTMRDLLELQWNDTVKARIIDEAGSNTFKSRGNRRKIRSQAAIYQYLAKQNAQK